MSTFDLVPLRDVQGEPAIGYVSSFLDREEVRALAVEISERERDYRSSFMRVGELWTKMPRLAAEYGDVDFTYVDTWLARSWPPVLDAIRQKVESRLRSSYNYAIANWYRSGRDFTGWHADKMEVHTPGSNIAMISVGETRELTFRDATTGIDVTSLAVEEGSLLVMFAASQVNIEHSIRPDPTVRDRRVSFTFRHLLTSDRSLCAVCGQRR